VSKLAEPDQINYFGARTDQNDCTGSSRGGGALPATAAGRAPAYGTDRINRAGRRVAHDKRLEWLRKLSSQDRTKTSAPERCVRRYNRGSRRTASFEPNSVRLMEFSLLRVGLPAGTSRIPALGRSALLREGRSCEPKTPRRISGETTLSIGGHHQNTNAVG
jgi:hypothetical protein